LADPVPRSAPVGLNLAAFDWGPVENPGQAAGRKKILTTRVHMAGTMFQQPHRAAAGDTRTRALTGLGHEAA
jgi:hypothetical protein